MGGHNGVYIVNPSTVFPDEAYSSMVQGIWGHRFLTLKGDVNSIQGYQNNLYLLHKDLNKKWYIRVFDLQGIQLKHWVHPDAGVGSNQLTIFKNNIYVSDRSSNRIIVYTSEGRVVYYLHCRLKPVEVASSTVTPAGNLLLAQCSRNLVECISLATGKTVWRSVQNEPSAVTTNSQSGTVVVAIKSSKILTMKLLSPEGKAW